MTESSLSKSMPTLLWSGETRELRKVAVTDKIPRWKKVRNMLVVGCCWCRSADATHSFFWFLKSIFNNLPLALYSIQITHVVLSLLHLSTQFGNSYGIFTVWLFTLLAVVAATVWPQVHDEAIDYHFSALGHDSTDWVPVELELVDRLWIPDAEILRLKGFT